MQQGHAVSAATPGWGSNDGRMMVLPRTASAGLDPQPGNACEGCSRHPPTADPNAVPYPHGPDTRSVTIPSAAPTGLQHHGPQAQPSNSVAKSPLILQTDASWGPVTHQALQLRGPADQQTRQVDRQGHGCGGGRDQGKLGKGPDPAPTSGELPKCAGQEGRLQIQADPVRNLSSP